MKKTEKPTALLDLESGFGISKHSYMDRWHIQAQHKDLDIPGNLLFGTCTLLEIVRLVRGALSFISLALLPRLMRHLTIWLVARPILQIKESDPLTML
jgi:hypothetical protein